MKISLIMATIGRSADIDAFFCSLPPSYAGSLEIIVVDQNKDDRVSKVLRPWFEVFDIKHVRTGQCGLSKARNLGMQYVSGEIVGFPDDDCLYEEGVLYRVRQLIADGFDIVALTANAPGGGTSNGFWLNEASVITFRNLISCIVSYSMFFKRSAIGDVRFDERLGVGATYGSGEELDFVLAIMHSGASGFYDNSLGVVHPYKVDDWRRGYNYGRGFGAYWIKELVMRRGFEFAVASFGILLRPVAGGVVSAICFDWERCRVRMASAVGRLEGAVSYRKIERDGHVV